MKKYQKWIEEQLILRGIDDDKILERFSKINRENFVREDLKSLAYLDSSLPTFLEQTISQPYVVALMTQILNPQKNEIILEIGTGSGYQAAILSKLTKKIISIEFLPKLCEFAKNNLKKENIKNVEIINGDGSTFEKKDFFDKIIVTAACRKIPNNWINSLKEGGNLIIPLDEGTGFQRLYNYEKKNGELKLILKSIPVVFVRLVGKNS